MNYMDYNCQGHKIFDLKWLYDSHFKNFVTAYTGWGAGNNPETFGVAFHHVGPTFIHAYDPVRRDPGHQNNPG